MREVKLSHGSHPAPFGADGEATMCAQEFAAYLAGEPHSDNPKCVSSVLNRFMVRWNDALDDETRQKLRPYIARTIGTAGDGQDEQRSYMAVDWLVRTNTPALLEAAGLVADAAKLRGLASIEGIEQARAAWDATEVVRAAGATGWAVGGVGVPGDIVWAIGAAAAAGDAFCPAGGAPWTTEATEAAGCAWAAAEAARNAARAAWAAWSTGATAAEAAWDTVGADEDTTWAASTTWTTAARATSVALVPTVAMLQASAFELLDRMIDPGGLHDILTEGELFERSDREPLAAERLS